MFQDEDTGKIRYSEMAADLRGFNYNQETNEGLLPKSANSISSGRRSYFGALVQRNVFPDDMLVLDSQKVPANKLDNIERQMIRVNRVLQDKFKTREVFETYLRERVDTDKNGNISVDEMKAMINETCSEEVVKRRLNKRDLEGFLSAFKYNVHGATDIGTIAPLVFEKDSNKLSIALTSRVRTNPPPAFVNEDVVAVEGDISEETTARRLRGLLTQIEDATFCSGKPRAFQIFKAFDTDGDGFVSYKDFEAHLVKNKIQASKQDIGLLMKNVLDTDGNGYIDFSTFKDKFGPNMSKLVAVPERELHLPNLCPNKEKIAEYGKRSSTVRNSVNQVRKSFQPEIDASKFSFSKLLTIGSSLPQNWCLRRGLAPSLPTLTRSSNTSRDLTRQATWQRASGWALVAATASSRPRLTSKHWTSRRSRRWPRVKSGRSRTTRSRCRCVCSCTSRTSWLSRRTRSSSRPPTTTPTKS